MKLERVALVPQLAGPLGVAQEQPLFSRGELRELEARAQEILMVLGLKELEQLNLSCPTTGITEPRFRPN